ncbi:hypothetical protein JTE90_006903 [Oedothorax gibbosus]|uniref:Uncharacterized protein n=1 Tax=Oedothorax gibbosus TaxID=931172 RepID=A0AAV6VQM9_9ARAC|nr:hypothetical protein JTE90_006903 [Oedothorax gibbosus]
MFHELFSFFANIDSDDQWERGLPSHRNTFGPCTKPSEHPKRTAFPIIINHAVANAAPRISRIHDTHNPPSQQSPK